jgi:hypothetical protein
LGLVCSQTGCGRHRSHCCWQSLACCKVSPSDLEADCDVARFFLQEGITFFLIQSQGGRAAISKAIQVAAGWAFIAACTIVSVRVFKFIDLPKMINVWFHLDPQLFESQMSWMYWLPLSAAICLFYMWLILCSFFPVLTFGIISRAYSDVKLSSDLSSSSCHFSLCYGCVFYIFCLWSVGQN